MNELSEWYTFDTPRAVGDIDVTLMNAVANRVFFVVWEIKGRWGLSDHNLIPIMVTSQSPLCSM